MEIRIFRLTLDTNDLLRPSDAEKIRGYLGNLFRDNSHMHQHKTDGSFIYHYPFLQYKIINSSCLLIGVNEGLGVAKEIFHNLHTVNLNGKWAEILSKGLESYVTSFSIASEQIQYSFLTPWLALNEGNYEKYKSLKGWSDKRELLKKILIGNIISVAKSVGYVIPEEIRVSRLKVWPVRTPVKLKGVDMTGFRGEFAVNFELPDYFGLGKSVSRGFGTIKRIK